MSKKILITGASSKIGRKLVNRLLNNGLEVKLLIRGNKADFAEKAELAWGDLENLSSLKKALENISQVVHLAGLTHSSREGLYWQVNTKGTENLVKASQEARVDRFIFISSRAINPAGGAYSQSKLAAESIIKNSCLNWVILRPAEVYGMGQGEMIDQFIKLVRKSFLVPVINNRKYPLAPLYIDDLVDALGETITKENLSGRIYTLAGPQSFSFEELIQEICRFYRLKRLKIYCPLFLLKVLKWLFQSVLAPDQISRLLSAKSADISLAQKDLDFRPRSFQDGLFLLK